MPIPPRPIPAPHPQQRRHHHSRRADVNLAGSGQSLIAEGRADVPILPRGASAPNTLSGVFVRPRSFSPLHSPLGTSPLLNSPLSSSPKRHATPPTPPRAEIPISQLINGSGRAPRTGAAAAMGFDFVARPTVIPIEDQKATEPQPTEPRSSFWAWRERYRASHPEPEASSDSEAEALAPLAAPRTPSLEPHVTDDEDDWEHVDAEEDGDNVLGELELGTEMDGSHALPSVATTKASTADVNAKLPPKSPVAAATQ